MAWCLKAEGCIRETGQSKNDWELSKKLNYHMEILWAYITAFLKKQHLEREHMTNNLVSSSIIVKNFTLAVSYF